HPHSEQGLQLTIASGSQSFNAYVLSPPPASYAHLWGATVRVRGVCGARFNKKRQLIGVYLLMNSAADIRVGQTAVDAYSLPVLPINSVMQFSLARASGHPLRVAGVVTLATPEGVYIQDGSGGVAIQTGQRESLAVGERIDAVGFPTIGEYKPVLQDAVFRRAGSAALPTPVDLTSEGVLTADYDARLITIAGR